MKGAILEKNNLLHT